MHRYAQIMTWKSGIDENLRQEWIKKRAEWTVPDGVNILAEYLVPAGGNQIIMVYEGEGLEALMAMRAPWLKYYNVDVYPAVEMNELIKATPKLLSILK